MHHFSPSASFTLFSSTLIALSLALLSATSLAAPLTGEVISPQRFEKRQVGGGKAVIEILKEGKFAFVGRLTLAAGASVPQHRDPTEEYLVITEGAGEITIEGVTSHVTAGDMIYMPANAEVSFKNGAQRLVALQVFAGPKSARKYDRWQRVSAPSTQAP